jgi:predicted DNA-binding transcriptional regulator AlpA
MSLNTAEPAIRRRLARPRAVAPVERKSFKIPEWGAMHGIGRSASYQLVKSGRGPRTVMIGGQIRITAEDDAAWLASQPTADLASMGDRRRGRAT